MRILAVPSRHGLGIMLRRHSLPWEFNEGLDGTRHSNRRSLKSGDLVELEIEKIGVPSNRVMRQ
jgi:2-keto-4-pentenoate hydratase/2-oxohepta-3-ene-1,7-dioic acid hydratase in catechol pathway